MPNEESSPAASLAKLTSSPRPRLGAALRVLLRTRIVAGLLTVIPIWVTWVAAKFVFDTMTFATKPLAKAVTELLVEANKGLVPDKFQAYVARVEARMEWIVPLVAVLLTLFFLYLLGLLTANVFGRRLIRTVENLFGHVPLVKTIYRSVKQVVMTLGGSRSMSFKKVVLVEFPRPGMKCIGFLTAVMKDMDTGRKMASVFISTTPNPTTGYMQILPLEEVSETNWTVEEAVKLLMSGGVLSPPTVAFDKIHAVDWKQIPAAGDEAFGPEAG